MVTRGQDLSAMRRVWARPSQFVEECLNRDGKRFRFIQRQHLPAIYDDPCDLLLKCSRQTEKSTGLANRAAMYLYGGNVTEEDGRERPIRLLYFSASWLQAQDFSKDRLARVLESPLFTESFAGGLPLWPRDRNQRSRLYVDQIGEKMLRNRAIIKLRACNQNADRVRGLSTDVIFGDEIQDILTGLFPVIEEAAARSPLRKRIYAGTPKTFDNAIEEKWRQSTMFEWMVRCRACNHVQMLTDKNVGERYFVAIQSGCICEHCGRPMDPQDGQWIATGDKHKLLHGYRICHVMLPQSEDGWKSIIDKKRNYTEQAYNNEVLGFSHEHSNVVLTERQFFAACSPLRRNGLWPDISINGRAAGVDWGGPGSSATVLTIGGFHDSRYRVLFVKNFKKARMSRDEEINTIARICAKWRVPVIMADYGGGVKENQDLRRVFHGHGMVIPVQNSGTSKKAVDWQSDGSNVLVVSRTMTLSTIFNLIQTNSMEFFCEDDAKEFKDGYTNTYVDYDKRGNMMYQHPETRPDDELHSLNYAYIGSAYQTGMYGIPMRGGDFVK